MSLLIQYNGRDTAIYANSKLHEKRREFDLLDATSDINGSIVFGNNSTATQPWIGTLARIAIFDGAVTPEQITDGDKVPRIDYVFDRVVDGRLQNQYGTGPPLAIPQPFQPFQRKRFTPLSSLQSRQNFSDLTINFLGFIPAGIAFFAIATIRTKNRFLQAALVAFGAFSLSLIIECAQMYLPSRDPSAIDLAVNTSSGTMIALCVALLPGLGRRRRYQLSDAI